MRCVHFFVGSLAASRKVGRHRGGEPRFLSCRAHTCTDLELQDLPKNTRANDNTSTPSPAMFTTPNHKQMQQVTRNVQLEGPS